MQASDKEKLNPAVHEFYSQTKINRDFNSYLKLDHDLQGDHDVRLDDDDKEEEMEEDDFSFNCGELSASPIAAEDAFVNGKIKPVLPLFNRDLFLSSSEDSCSLHENLPKKPPVKKIFVETRGDDHDDSSNGQEMMSSGLGGDEIVGPYCEWSGRPKAVEASPVDHSSCKKSNSTGFSKIWRIRERVGRCSSDGKDAFVFLNNGRRDSASAVGEEEKSEKAVKINKQGGKKNSKAASLSAHEAYLRSKAQGDERRRSYLPYRPDLVGFFTNVNGGLTKNVHPF